MSWKMIALLRISILATTSASRILLVHPLYSKSHDFFHSAMANHLLDAGHHVTAFTSMPGTVSHLNYTEVDCLRPDLPVAGRAVSNFVPLSYVFQMKNSFQFLGHVLESSVADCHHTIQLEQMQKILKSSKKLFDVLIVDLVLYTFECFLPIAEKLDIPVIGTVATKSWRNTESIMGNPYNPAVVPFELSYYSHEMTFVQRLHNTIDYLLDVIFHQFIIYPQIETLYQKYFPNTTLASRKKPSLLFLNSNPVLAPRPLVPNVINVGGIHVQPVMPLPNNLRIFIEGAKNGVILFSLGSMVQSYTLPNKILSVFREVFAQIPQRIIWKSEKKIDALSDNVLLSNWLPQRDILAHKNVVAFITHSGIAGTFEGVHSGVPMILTPLHFDQFSNAAALQQLGVGVCIDLETLTKEELLKVLNDVINGTKYTSQARVVSKMITDQPVSPQENLLFWTEYVIRHNGAKQLNSAAASLPTYRYLLLDVIGFILLVTIAVISSLYFASKMVSSLIQKHLRISEKSKKTD